MAGQTIPGAGLTGFWGAGFNGWGGDNDSNLELLSVLAGANAKSRTTSLPGSPNSGDIYIVPSGAGSNPNDIAVYDSPGNAGAWSYFTPQKGWTFWIDDESAFYSWDGSSWSKTVAPETSVSDGGSQVLAAPTDINFAGSGVSVADDADGTVTVTVPGGSGVSQSEKTSGHTLTDSDLGGGVLIRMNLSSAGSVTVPSGLTGTEPVTVIQTGSGQVDFSAGTGVTINAADGNLKTRVQYSSATLVPDAGAADSYYLVGDLAA